MARRRLRLIERPAPPAAGQLSSFAFGAGAIAAFALLVMWIQPVTTRGHDCRAACSTSRRASPRSGSPRYPSCGCGAGPA